MLSNNCQRKARSTAFLFASIAICLFCPCRAGAQSTTNLLFEYVSNSGGYDTEITLTNASEGITGVTPQFASCTLHYYGFTMVGPTPPDQNVDIPAGGEVKFSLQNGNAALGINPAPGFRGYIIAECQGLLVRGYYVMHQIGGNGYAIGEKAEVLALPRSSQNLPLLFSFVTNQAGFDTVLVLVNTSSDSFGTREESGTCTLHYYGNIAGGGPVPGPQTTINIQAGSFVMIPLSIGGNGIAATPGFQGYIIADCEFSHARGYAVELDRATLEVAYSMKAELISRERLSRVVAEDALLFPFVSNQVGFDTGIVIANTSLDPFGHSGQNGTCTLDYYGANAPASQTSQEIRAGSLLVMTLSGGGTHGMPGAPNFQGYVIAKCTFPLARGYSVLSDLGMRRTAAGDKAELITLPRQGHQKQLLLQVVDAQAGKDTGIAILNTSQDPLGGAGESGTCTLSYYGEVVGGGALPVPQTSRVLNPGEYLTFTLFGGSLEFAATPGFHGYIIADCDFDHARAYVYTSDLGAIRYAWSQTAELIDPTDSDSDSTPDFADLCPADANKTEPGRCGCGTADRDLNGDGVIECPVDQNGICPVVSSASLDCANDPLPSSACVGVNGFLGQINIVSVINLQAGPLRVRVDYYDLAGVRQGRASTSLQAGRKFDFIINDLGLAPDTYGTVCVTTNAAADGLWAGGVAIYKPDMRSGMPSFGESFDFALYYPFETERTGKTAVPLSTYHIGTDAAAAVANWISITDAERGDGEGLRGTLRYYDAAGTLVSQEAVNIPDGGRMDYAGHTGLTGGANIDATGLAQFTPSAKADGSRAEYYLHVARYFYDCPGASCSNFLAAFNLPYRPAARTALSGGISTRNSETAVLELINPRSTASRAEVELWNGAGTSLGGETRNIPARGTQHIVVNRLASGGYLASDTAGSASVTLAQGSASAVSVFYKLDANGRLLYAYAAPFLGNMAQVQTSQFNSFISHTNTTELVNLTAAAMVTALEFVDWQGLTVYQQDVLVPAHGTVRLENLALPLDSYGIITAQSPTPGILMRNYMRSSSQYALTFPGQ